MAFSPPAHVRRGNHVFGSYVHHKQRELIQINTCQICLQAISTTDICNSDGTRIAQQAYDGTFVQRNTNIRWPNQHRPTK
jgi:hypothetical protein